MLTNDLTPGRTGSKSINSMMTMPVYTVATVPAAATYPNRMIVVSNGNAGVACLAWSNGTSWLRIVPGAAVAAS
jgi:hypothetical protein